MAEDELRKHVESSVASEPVAMFLKKKGICDAGDIVATSTLRDILDLNAYTFLSPSSRPLRSQPYRQLFPLPFQPAYSSSILASYRSFRTNHLPNIL